MPGSSFEACPKFERNRTFFLLLLPSVAVFWLLGAVESDGRELPRLEGGRMDENDVGGVFVLLPLAPIVLAVWGPWLMGPLVRQPE